jgi:pectinesterase
MNAVAQNKTWKSITEQSEGSWFATNEAKAIAENVLLYQRNIGGWPKNIQMHKPLLDEEKVELKALKDNSDNVTTANGATFQEMVFLSKMYRQVPDNEYKKAFLLGLDYILKAQYDNGGWPRTYPLKSGYFSHITYNDDSMINILTILKEIKNRTNYFSITPSDEIIKKSEIAFNKGIDCILKTQYKQNGVLTSWCGQHDAVTLQPTKARPYELPSLSGSESVSIVLFLMAIEKPSKEISDAIVNAVNWFEKVKIIGLREEVILNENGKIIDKKMIPDANAPVIWSRFMELEDNRAFFSDRDGIKKYALSEISSERRNGYKWYTNEPQKVFKNYPLWKKKNNI